MKRILQQMVSKELIETVTWADAVDNAAYRLPEKAEVLMSGAYVGGHCATSFEKLASEEAKLMGRLGEARRGPGSDEASSASRKESRKR